jgi:protease-4
LRILGIVVLMLSLALNLILLVGTAINGGFGSERSSRQTTITEGDSRQKIAVVPIVTSMMMETQAEQFSKLMDDVEKDENVKAIVLKIDTPGGAVTAADEMYHRLIAYKAKKPGIPVVATMGGTAASGGYYAACAADYVFAQPTTITGSIGVLLPQFNLSKFGDKYGIEDTSLHATGADYKTAGSWLKPPTPEETQYFVDLIDSAFTQFKSVVTTGRASRLKQPIGTIANGKAYTADQAKALGLIDQIGYPTDAYSYAAGKAGLSSPMVVKFEAPESLLDIFASSRSGLPPMKASGGVQINGVQIDATKLEEFLTPRLLYLWRGN